jgi:phosphate acetyltransferase
MSKNLYIATLEPRAGQSVVALGILELLSRRLNKIGSNCRIVKGVLKGTRDLIFIFTMIYDSTEGDPETPLLFVDR